MEAFTDQRRDERISEVRASSVADSALLFRSLLCRRQGFDAALLFPFLLRMATPARQPLDFSDHRSRSWRLPWLRSLVWARLGFCLFVAHLLWSLRVLSDRSTFHAYRNSFLPRDLCSFVSLLRTAFDRGFWTSKWGFGIAPRDNRSQIV